MESVSAGAILYNPDGEPNLRFRHVTRTPGSWTEELKASALSVANRAGKPLWLAMSGGIESEIMARCFFDQGINFSAFTFEFDARRNRTAVTRAKTWCFTRGIPHRTVPFDRKSFFTTDVDRYIKEGYRTGSPYRYLQLRLLETVEYWGGFAVLGHGKIGFQKQSDSEDLSVELYPSFIAPFEWCRRNKSNHEPFFFMSTPEVIRSFLAIPFVEGALKMPAAFTNPLNNVALRRFVHQAMWPNIESRTSWLGFERERLSMREANEKVRSAFPDWNTRIVKSVPELIAELDGKS